MGVDLDLIVERSQGGRYYRILRSYHLFQQLSDGDFGERSKQVCYPKEITDEIAKDFDDLPDDLKCGYGGRLRYISAGEAAKARLSWECDETIQMIEHFKRLPPETKIAMFWH